MLFYPLFSEPNLLKENRYYMAEENTGNENVQYLAFESEVAKLDEKMQPLKDSGDNPSELLELQRKQVETLKDLYANLTPWQTVQVSRHPQRPLFEDYLSLMIKDFRELHGDRCFGDDRSIITGLGQIGREKVMIIGQNKGRDIKSKIACQFGCPNPEGYRKALLKMKLAEKFNLPIVTFIDTPGAYPGIEAEERGQAQAIAVNLMEMSRLKTPIICIVIGEGGSGGALGIGVGDKLAILEYAYYSVISPEGCAAILWRDGAEAEKAAEQLNLTSKDLYRLKLVDEIIKEPLGAAHRNIHDTIYNVEKFISKSLKQLKRIDTKELLDARYKKIRSIGANMVELSAEKKTKKIPIKIESIIKKAPSKAKKAVLN